jgi:hypothetical protein
MGDAYLRIIFSFEKGVVCAEVKCHIKNIEAYHERVLGESLVKEGWQSLFG